MTRAAGRVHPARPLGPIFSSAAVTAGWWLVAHSSGQGWVQALGDLVFAALLVGVVGPAVALARTGVRVTRGPGDGVTGQPVPIHLAVTGRVRIRPLEPAGPEQFVGPAGRGGGDDHDHLVLLPGQRGVHRDLLLEVSSAAPFGLQWWTRRLRVELPQDLHVSPRPGRPVPVPDQTDREGGADGRRVSLRREHTGDLRAARPYRPGDSRSRVHWTLSAHAGELMIREMEKPLATPLEVTVVLPEDRAEAERLAGDALATVSDLLGRGTPTVLITDEAGGPVRAPVPDPRAAGRRLAAAVPGRTGAAGVDVRKTGEERL